MTDKKLTDAEIKSAWEVLNSWQQVALQNDDGTDTESPQLYEAIEIVREQINRLQAENEKNENIIRLADKTIETQQAENERLNKAISYQKDLAERMFIRQNGLLEEAKAEAYKEFAERLKKQYDDYSDHSSLTVKMFCYDIDNLLKEMAGDGND